MRIDFTCRTNKPYVMINKLLITLPTGSVIGVDRDTTGYHNEEGELTMTWDDCYLWDLDGQNIFCDETGKGLYLYDWALEEFTRLIKSAKVKFELEDDAPDGDYTVDILSYSVY